MTISMFRTADFWGNQQCMFISWSVLWLVPCCIQGHSEGLTVHVHKLELLCCIQGQGHSEGDCLPEQYLWSVKLVWWCIIISHSIIQKYNFAMFKVKATIVYTSSLQILWQPKLVWWYIITRQGKTQWKDFLAFRQGVRQRIWLRGLWSRLLLLSSIPSI